MSKQVDQVAPFAVASHSEQVLEQEKIGVRSIRVIERKLGSTAIVGTFFSAERMLLGWSNQCKGVLDCEFEILYHDGYRISGAYRFRCRNGRRPGLMQFVRTTAAGLDHGAGCHGRVDGLAQRPAAFLAAYETDDFASG